MYIGLHVKYPLFFSILMKLEFSRHILEKSPVSNFMKIRPKEADLFHENGQTDRLDKVNSRFLQFGNAPKKTIQVNHLIK